MTEKTPITDNEEGKEGSTTREFNNFLSSLDKSDKSLDNKSGEISAKELAMDQNIEKILNFKDNLLMSAKDDILIVGIYFGVLDIFRDNESVNKLISNNNRSRLEKEEIFPRVRTILNEIRRDKGIPTWDEKLKKLAKEAIQIIEQLAEEGKIERQFAPEPIRFDLGPDPVDLDEEQALDQQEESEVNQKFKEAEMISGINYYSGSSPDNQKERRALINLFKITLRAIKKNGGTAKELIPLMIKHIQDRVKK